MIHTRIEHVVERTKAKRVVRGLFNVGVDEEEFYSRLREKTELEAIHVGLSKFTTLVEGEVLRVDFVKNREIVRATTKMEVLGR